MCSLTRVPSAAVAVETNGVSAVLVLSVADGAPQLMRISEGIEMTKSQVGHLLIGESGEGIDTLHLLDHRSVVVDTPVCDLVELATVKDVLDTDLILVLLNKVTQGNSSLEANEAGAEVEKQVTVTILSEQRKRLYSASEPNPRTTRQ